MIRENLGFRVLHISIVFAGIFLSVMVFGAWSLSEAAGLKILNPVHGPAKIKGEDASYYTYKARFAAETGSSLIFKQDECLIFDKKGKKFSKCWIHIAGASDDLSVTRRPPINMKKFAVKLEGGKSSDVVQWNTSMVDGPNGALEFRIPKGGYVEINFLWQVPWRFSPGRIKIADLVEVSF